MLRIIEHFVYSNITRSVTWWTSLRFSNEWWENKNKTRAPIEIQSGNIIFKYPLRINRNGNEKKIHTQKIVPGRQMKREFAQTIFADWMTTKASQVKPELDWIELSWTQLNQQISTIEPINSVDVIHSKFLMDHHIFDYTYQAHSHLYGSFLVVVFFSFSKKNSHSTAILS